MTGHGWHKYTIEHFLSKTEKVFAPAVETVLHNFQYVTGSSGSFVTISEWPFVIFSSFITNTI